MNCLDKVMILADWATKNNNGILKDKMHPIVYLLQEKHDVDFGYAGMWCYPPYFAYFQTLGEDLENLIKAGYLEEFDADENVKITDKGKEYVKNLGKDAEDFDEDLTNYLLRYRYLQPLNRYGGAETISNLIFANYKDTMKPIKIGKGGRLVGATVTRPCRTPPNFKRMHEINKRIQKAKK